MMLMKMKTKEEEEGEGQGWIVSKKDVQHAELFRAREIAKDPKKSRFLKEVQEDRRSCIIRSKACMELYREVSMRTYEKKV